MARKVIVPPQPVMTSEQKRAKRELAAALRAVPDHYLDCYDPSIGHAWMKDANFEPHDVQQVGRRKLQFLKRVTTCARCGTTKTLVFVEIRAGIIERIGRPHVVRPDDYKLPGVPRGVKPSIVVQQEAYRREMETATRVPRGARATAER